MSTGWKALLVVVVILVIFLSYDSPRAGCFLAILMGGFGTISFFKGGEGHGLFLSVGLAALASACLKTWLPK